MSWNGLVISAFARASQILKDEPEGTRFYFPVVGSNVSLHYRLLGVFTLLVILIN